MRAGEGPRESAKGHDENREERLAPKGDECEGATERGRQTGDAVRAGINVGGLSPAKWVHGRSNQCVSDSSNP